MIKSTILSIFLLASSCQKKLEEGAESYYTCSMHPQVREKEPTKCPICHMALTKVEKVKKESSKTTWACKDYPLVTSEKKDVCPLDGTPMVRVNSPAMAVG